MSDEPTPHGDLHPPMDPSEASASSLAALVRSGVWPALLDVRDRVHWSIEIVDGSLNAMLGAFGGRAPARAGRLLANMTTPAVRASARECLQRLESTSIRVGRVTIVCVPIVRNRRSMGAVLVAHELPPDADTTATVARMTRFGDWLAKSLQAYVEQPAANANDLRQLSSLLRILRRAAAKGVEEDVVRSFIEALSVWQDVEAWGYRGLLDGPFVLEASLPGSISVDVPREIRREAIATLSELAMLPAETAGGLGFKNRFGVAVVPIRTDAAAEWLMVFPRTTGAPWESTLVVYCDLLGPALDDAAAVESLRLTWAVVEHLLPGPSPESFESAARQAVNELATASHAAAWLTVLTGDGGRVLSVSAPAGERSPAGGAGREISVELDAGSLCTARLGLRAAEGRGLTRRELNLLRSAGEVLGPWIKAGAGRLALAQERRVVSRTFDQIVERQARHAATRRDDVSVIVIALGERAHLPELAHAWIGEIRKSVRPTDMTGRLSSGDIGILLLETPPRRAHFVAHRIQQLISADHGFGSLPDAGVGVAGWSGHQPPGSVVVEASARATAGSRWPTGPEGGESAP